MAAAAVMGLVVCTGAEAQGIYGGSLYAGPAQFRAVCYFYNAGAQTVELRSPAITAPGGAKLALVVNECGAQLLPNRSCGIAAKVRNTVAYNCGTYVAPATLDLRGVFEMRDRDGTSLARITLR
jgi:hypothetical protein